MLSSLLGEFGHRFQVRLDEDELFLGVALRLLGSLEKLSKVASHEEVGLIGLVLDCVRLGDDELALLVEHGGAALAIALLDDDARVALLLEMLNQVGMSLLSVSVGAFVELVTFQLQRVNLANAEHIGILLIDMSDDVLTAMGPSKVLLVGEAEHIRGCQLLG